MSNEPANKIDPRKLAANAKVVIQPAPTQPQKVAMPAKLQGLSTLPKPTNNPAPKPEQTQGVIANDSKQQIAKVEPEVIKKDETISPRETETVKNGKEATQFKEGHPGGPGRPPKKQGIDYMLEQELDKPHGKLPDGSIITKRQMLAKVLADKALDGNLKAIEILSNRVEGKPMQKIQVVAPEDAEGTVLAHEAQEKLLETFGRKPKYGTNHSTTNQGA